MAHDDDNEPYWLYGFHAVRAALSNPRRTVHRMVASRNALNRLEMEPPQNVDMMDVRAISKLLGNDVVHQGIAIYVEPLETRTLDALNRATAVLCLDHITDPHNVGAILRSAVAFKVDAVVTTRRHSASETGALAKAASGALDLIDVVAVTNLSRAIGELQNMGFATAALDSEAPLALEDLAPAPRWAFVLGAEGKGVRQGVVATCGQSARIEADGALASLNVSNAAAITLYAMRRTLLKG